jgi:hypothetical protein
LHLFPGRKEGGKRSWRESVVRPLELREKNEREDEEEEEEKE